jgi:hypothetical protein
MTKDLSIMRNLHEFFVPRIQALPCQETTKSYIVSVLAAPEKLKNLSGQSITLCFAEAKSRWNFASFQNLGDWILFAESVYPASLTDVEPEYYFTIAQMSYYNCFKITRRQLSMYEELADQLEPIITGLRHKVCPDREDTPIDHYYRHLQ